jgi:23S rRNA (cytidine1920-2'-O)/16S rRNA (cytidine1409-2'-O)-methyltransferase
MRLDVYLVKHAILSSRELAKFNIAKGNVIVNGKVASKASQAIDEGDNVSLLAENSIPYVSKGGLKLEKGLKEFQFICQGIEALDVGASTGGFTDCLLKHGAKFICAIDVGSNQLAPVLKDNPNVHSIENINIKDLQPQDLQINQFDLLVADLSFISLAKVIEYFPKFLKPSGAIISLIKPQFEVGPRHVGKGGLVKDPKAHLVALANIGLTANKHGLYVKEVTYAPIHEAGKNIEYLVLLIQNSTTFPDFAKVVNDAFNELKTK